MRRILTTLALLAAAVATLATSAGADDAHTYKIEMYNAFGLVEGSDVRIAGVNAGSVTDLDINEAKRAVVSIELSGELGTLGEKTRCSSEPQSLIAEYFISCEPAGPPLEEGGMIPASRVTETVQNDLVQNTLREPYRVRLTLLINEFGTALAGNPDALNEAIRLGAPALTQLRKVTSILASQNRIIRDLNANSDQVIGRLTDRKEDVVRFIEEARDTAEASAARREDLSQDFALLDEFLTRLRPTLARLSDVAETNTPLLADLKAAASGLNRLVLNLPAFSDASRGSLDSLGEASTVGSRALKRGGDEIRLLAESGKRAPKTGEILADLLRDLDDPRRAVEIDDRVPDDTGRTNPNAGTKNTKGYTGLEGLLNYVHYQTGALNQFDQIGHLLHFSLYYVFSGPCGNFSTGRDAQTGEPGVPAADGGTTTNILEADPCVGWLGPNQPGLNEDLDLAKYDQSVCPNGTAPERAREELCDPNERARDRARSGARQRGAGRGEGTSGEGDGGSGDEASNDGGGGDEPAAQAPGDSSGSVPDDILDDILDLPPSALDDLPEDLSDQLQGLGSSGQSESGTAATDNATEDLLDFLFEN